MAEPQQSIFAMLMEKRPEGFTESILYEDDSVVAILDKFPSVEGHTLVIPKRQVESYCDLTDEECSALAIALRKVTRQFRDAGFPHFNIVENNGKPAGQEVPHVHFHVVPRVKGDFSKGLQASMEANRVVERPSPLPDVAFEGSVKELRDKLRVKQ